MGPTSFVFQRVYYTPVEIVQQNQQHKPKQNWNLDNTIILDSGSTIKGTFMNIDLVASIKLRNIPLYMSTNVETKQISL